MFLHGVEQDNVHEQEDKTNGLSIRRHRRDSFSIIPRLPFDIHRDSLSEQLVRSSPLLLYEEAPN